MFGLAGRDVLPVIHAPTASVAAERWPVYAGPPGAIGSPAEGAEVATLLGGNVACHLKGHGMVFVGTTVSKSMLAAADAEEQAEVTWRADARRQTRDDRDGVPRNRRGRSAGSPHGPTFGTGWRAASGATRSGSTTTATRRMRAG